MPVLINFKICDNSKDCSGISVCPTSAFHWNEKKKIIEIDEKKCTSCGTCEKSCPVGAIHVAKTVEEFKKLKKEIDEDPRKVHDLFVDRYGAQPIHEAFLINEDEFNIQILEASKLAAAEFFKNETIMCLLNSIPIRDIFKDMDIKYRKVDITTEKLLKKYNIKKLPSLLFFKEGKLIGKIEGYVDDKDKMKKEVNKIVKKVA